MTTEIELDCRGQGCGQARGTKRHLPIALMNGQWLVLRADREAMPL
jgi:hypothetical protein